jgi:hypothetical protein
MKTKTSAKSSPKSAKPAKSVSKLASLKGALKDVMPKALFSSPKGGKAPAKAAPTKASASAAKSATPAKGGKAAPSAKTAAAPKVTAAKAAAAPVKGAKAAAPKAAAPAPAPVALTKPPKVAKVAKAPRAPRLSAEEMCREVACESLCTAGGYCRLHYIKNWKKIKRKELILKEGKLNQYIEELVAKYPDKYIEAIRSDLNDDKAFASVIHDLDLDESTDDFEVDGENLESMVDNIKGRDFDDEGDAF